MKVPRWSDAPTPSRDTEDMEHLAKFALGVLLRVNWEERVRFFEALLAVYCQHCGSPHADSPGGHCQCWNDE